MALTKENAKNLLSSLEGYHQILKELHWSANSQTKHALTDNIDAGVLKFEDDFAEVVMGRLGERFSKGDLRTMLPESEDLQGILREMRDDVNDFVETMKGEEGCSGIYNVIDDFLSKVYKWQYLETLE